MLHIQELVQKVTGYYPADAAGQAGMMSPDMIQVAYDVAEVAHRGQVRDTGEPYIGHPLAVANLLADLRLDVATICAGLLHDCVEDTDLTSDQIRAKFGPEVAFLVDGVTKLSQMPWQNRREQQAENFRKMLLAMARDIRVILIKLCDRLDNMRSIAALSDERQQRIGRETLEIYAPLAHRLGIQWIKSSLDDLSFRCLHPKEFKELSEKLERHFSGRPTYMTEAEKTLHDLLLENGIDAQVNGRIKHLWSIYQKTVKTGHDVDQLYDIVAFRIIVPSVRDCYGGLGVIHGKWTPVPGRFKDFIALPKSNRYQSLHTTVIGPMGERMEVQLRTSDMHRIAEEGIAAHWKYKEGQPHYVGKEDDKTFAWLHQLMEWQKTLKDPTEFIETVKVDLFDDEVFVFTPQGDVKVLPQGATPIDFAYLVHTEVGHQCMGARVNGLMVPLGYQLKNGDTVQIVTNASHRPGRDWLRMVVSSGAKSKIRAALRSEQRERSKELGKELLEKELRRHGFSFKDQQAFLLGLAQKWKLASMDGLFCAIGYGKKLVSEVVQPLLPVDHPVPDASEPSQQKPVHSQRILSSHGICVAGESNVLVRFGKCCSPLVGDSIVGIITRGRGVTVHTKMCSAWLEQDEARRVDVHWDDQTKMLRPVSLQILCTDRPGLLAQLSHAFHQQGVDITQANCRTIDQNKALNTFACRVRDLDQLSALIVLLKKIPNVETVQRM